MESSRVKVLSKLSVVSAKPTEPGKVHRPSDLDRAMGRHTIHIVFYYGSNPFNDGRMLSDLDNLRVSLSVLLDKYPVVTGRLAREGDGGWVIKCNDAGVRMLQASVGETLDEWLRSADAEEERNLTVWEEMPQDPTYWSPFRIQINNFKCGGLAIGLSCTHMHADITSATLLITSWTQVHRGIPLTYPPTFHLPPPHPAPTSNLTDSSTTPPKMATATLKFSDSAIRNRLSELHDRCPDATPFDVLAALFWSTIARLLHDDRKRSLSICVDLRSRGDSGSSNMRDIPYNYFGNALHFSTLDVEAHELQSGGLGRISGQIHRHIAGLKGEALGRFAGHIDGPIRMYGPQLTCVNAEHMVDAENGEGLMYGAVFDKGERPVHVSYHVGNVVGEGLIMVMPSAEGGLGRAVTVVLPEEQMAGVCKDDAVLDLEPVMVLSGRK